MVGRILTLITLALLSVAACAQTTHTFTFGKFAIDSYTGMVTGCSEMQTLDGQPANQAIGYAGEICVPYNDTPQWGIVVPQVWGFPNNGQLEKNNSTPPQLSAPTFPQSGCGPRVTGCIDYETGTSDFVGYGQGVTVSVTVWFQVNKHVHYGRGCYPCVYYTNDETNGTGTATY